MSEWVFVWHKLKWVSYVMLQQVTNLQFTRVWHDEWSVFPAVNELCQSELSTLPVSSINSLHTCIKHRKKMPLRTFHRKRTWCTNAGSRTYLHTCTHMRTHTFITHHTTAQIFHGPKVSVWNISTCNVCYRKYSYL